LTDEEIVSIIKSNNDEPKTDLDEEPPKVISKTEKIIWIILFYFLNTR